ncbi:MAG: FHA domain-containing protein [Solirubrobacteraceae bacterium]|nr:FHA domain-containing protein [Solirubrobacteraceae bacterium]
MDLVQLTTHIDATAVRAAIGTPDAYVTRESRDIVDQQVRERASVAALLILFDGGRHEEHELHDGGTLRIGRSITADIPLEDPMISRKHAVIERHGSTIRVLDDRSLNGVFVNGARIDGSQTLGDADEVQIAGFVMRLILPS